MNLNELLQQVKQDIKELPITEYSDSDRNGVLIDVREDNEFSAGQVSDAIHIGRGVIEFKLSQMPEIEKDTPLYLYCRSGNRSLLAARSLKDIGYTNVTSLSGGYVAWAAANPSTLA